LSREPVESTNSRALGLHLSDFRFRRRPFPSTLVLTSERQLSRKRRIAADGVSDPE
jgi:hypothetical protein